MKITGTISIPGKIEVPLITREIEVDDNLIKNSNDPDSLVERAFMNAVKEEFKIEVWYMK